MKSTVILLLCFIALLCAGVLAELSEDLTIKATDRDEATSASAADANGDEFDFRSTYEQTLSAIGNATVPITEQEAGAIVDAMALFADRLNGRDAAWEELQWLIELHDGFAALKPRASVLVLAKYNIAWVANQFWSRDNSSCPMSEDEMRELIVGNCLFVQHLEGWIAHPGLLNVLMASGDLLEMWGYPMHAVRLWEAAVKHQGRVRGNELFPEVRLASFSLAHGDTELAFEWSRRCVRRSQQCGVEIERLGASLADLARHEDSLKVMRIAENVGGWMSPYFMMQRGLSLTVLGDYEDAVLMLSSATATTGRTFQVYTHNIWSTLGLAELHLGQCMSARQHLFNSFGTTHDMAPRSPANENGTVVESVWDATTRGDGFVLFRGNQRFGHEQLDTPSSSHLPEEVLASVRANVHEYAEKSGMALTLPRVRLEGAGQVVHLLDMDYKHAIFLGDGGSGTTDFPYRAANLSLPTSFFSNEVLLTQASDNLYHLMVEGMSRLSVMLLSPDFQDEHARVNVLLPVSGDSEAQAQQASRARALLRMFFPTRSNIRLNTFDPAAVRVMVDKLYVGDWYTDASDLQASNGVHVSCISGKLPPKHVLWSLRQQVLPEEPQSLSIFDAKVIYVPPPNNTWAMHWITDEHILTDALERYFGASFVKYTGEEDMYSTAAIFKKAAVVIGLDNPNLATLLLAPRLTTFVQLPTTSYRMEEMEYLTAVLGMRHVVVAEAATPFFSGLRMTDALAQLIVDTAAEVLWGDMYSYRPSVSSLLPSNQRITALPRPFPPSEPDVAQLILPLIGEKVEAEQEPSVDETLLGDIELDGKPRRRRRKRSGEKASEGAAAEEGKEQDATAEQEQEEEVAQEAEVAAEEIVEVAERVEEVVSSHSLEIAAVADEPVLERKDEKKEVKKLREEAVKQMQEEERQEEAPAAASTQPSTTRITLADLQKQKQAAAAAAPTLSSPCNHLSGVARYWCLFKHQVDAVLIPEEE